LRSQSDHKSEPVLVFQPPAHQKLQSQSAALDFGGHRVEALKATDEAIRQLEICLKYDKD